MYAIFIKLVLKLESEIKIFVFSFGEPFNIPYCFFLINLELCILLKFEDVYVINYKSVNYLNYLFSIKKPQADHGFKST